MSDSHYPILAFLQNAYIRPEHRVGDHVERYATDHLYRARCLARSMTGRRLARAWGELYSQVWWDNSTPVAGEDRRAMLGADPHHMVSVFRRVQPQAIVLYGQQAQHGWATAMIDLHRAATLSPFMVFCAPHPAAFDVSTRSVMRDLVIRVCHALHVDPPPTHEAEMTAPEPCA